MRQNRPSRHKAALSNSKEFEFITALDAVPDYRNSETSTVDYCFELPLCCRKTLSVSLFAKTREFPDSGSRTSVDFMANRHFAFIVSCPQVY